MKEEKYITKKLSFEMSTQDLINLGITDTKGFLYNIPFDVTSVYLHRVHGVANNDHDGIECEIIVKIENKVG